METDLMKLSLRTVIAGSLAAGALLSSVDALARHGASRPEGARHT